MVCDLKKLAAEYGTPLYIYDAEAVAERMNVLRNALGKTVEIIYAVKANPNPNVLQFLKPLVDGLDLSSGGEFSYAMHAGYTGKEMSLAGPGKTDQEIAYAISNDCGSISIESLDDLERIVRVAEGLKKKANVSIRINPLQLIPKFAMKMGGKATQFGVDEEAIEPVVACLKYNAAVLNFVGYHIYAGTQCLDADSFKENFNYIFTMIRKLHNQIQLPIHKINLGGGFGVPYFEGMESLDIQQTGKYLQEEIASFAKDFPKTKYVIELGRYIIAEAGYYLTSVLAVKSSRDKTFVILDGGMHHNQSAAGNLGQVIKKNYRIENLTHHDGPKAKVDLAGCLCTPIDTMGINVELPPIKVGDIIAFYNSGAYGYTASPLYFLGHALPQELLISKGQPWAK
jgi:diaminopimelate decarboxylase